MSNKQPNILIIVTDQQRADTIGALGNATIKTPAIDRLVESGTSFTRAYTPSPICSPARVAMATGIPPHVHRFTDHDWWHWEAENGPQTSAPHDSSFMTDCHLSGYQTFMAGKLHFHGRSWLTDGVEMLAGGEPQISQKTEVTGSYTTYLKELGYPPYVKVQGLSSEYYSVPQTTHAPVEHTRPWWTAQQCLRFLDRRDTNRPFLMHCHFEGPHVPLCNPFPWALLYRANEMDAPERPQNYKEFQSRTNRYQNRYKCKDTAQEDDTGYRILKAAYYANISLIDYNIGRILDALGDELANTVVVFTCDHGEMMGDYGCVGKRCMLEAAIRVPMVVVWPGYIPQQKISSIPVSLLDIYPTIMHVLGNNAESRSSEGKSLVDIASLPENDTERMVFSQFSSGWCGQYGVSDGTWKYMYSAPDNREWLFKVSDTLAESENYCQDSTQEMNKKRLKMALIQRHEPLLDPYSNAVENGDWKIHTPPPESYLEDPTYGYLCQEGKEFQEALQRDIDALGPYARKVTGIQRGNLHADHKVLKMDTPFD
jgi:arylsulfatase